jgi:TonB family protein
MTGVMEWQDAGGARTRWSLLASAVLHTLVLLALVLLPHETRATAPVTEITMIDPGTLAEAAAVAPAAAASEASVGAMASADHEARFHRTLDRAPLAPDPQRDAFADDRLNARLAAMQDQASRPAVGAVAASNPSPWASAPAVLGDVKGTGGAPLAMRRDGAAGGSALPLVRSAGHGAAPALAVAAPPAVERRAAAAGGGDANARRTLAGATLMGPIADRAVLAHVTPVYPEWAKRDGVEGSVTLYFVVEPDGSVRENVLVQQTAGFGEFDDNARAALRAWRFAPLADGRVGDQWGTIRFNFRLRD